MVLNVNTQTATSGSCDGIILMSASGGLVSYTYDLIGPDGYEHSVSSESNEEVKNLCAGEYTVTVTDANGCVRTETIDLKGCQSLDVTVNKKGTCFGLSNGEIALNSDNNAGTGSSSTGITGVNGNSSCPGKLYDGLCYDYSAKEIGSDIGDYIVKDEVVLLRGSFNYDITVDGGVLVVCGSVQIKGLTLINGGSAQIYGSMMINPSSSPTVVPEGCSIVNIDGNLDIYNNVELYGSILH